MKRSKLEAEDLTHKRRVQCADWLAKAAVKMGAKDTAIERGESLGERPYVERQHTRILLDFPGSDGNPAHTMIVELDVLEND